MPSGSRVPGVACRLPFSGGHHQREACLQAGHQLEADARVGHAEAKADQPSTGRGGQGVDQVPTPPAPTFREPVREPTGDAGRLQPGTLAEH